MQDSTRFDKDRVFFFVLFLPMAAETDFESEMVGFSSFIGLFVNLMFHTDEILMKLRSFRLFRVVFYFRPFYTRYKGMCVQRVPLG